MAIAKKCDVCGALYERYNELQDAKKVNGLRFLNVDQYQKVYQHNIIDCCPYCMNKIRTYIDSLGTNEKE